MKKGVVYAFPYPNFNSGMTLRDYFAGQALVGLVVDYVNEPDIGTGDIVRASYGFADAMLAERDKRDNETTKD